MAGYKFILFDADNTLFDFTRSEREAVAEALRDFGFDPTDGVIDDYSRINQSLWEKLERGETEKHRLRVERFELLFEKEGYDPDKAHAVSDRYSERLAGKAYLIDGAEEILKSLAPHAGLYIVTNGIKNIQESRFDMSGLGKYIRASFISEEIGFEKPDARFFDEVERRIPDFSRAEALIVGDSLTSDIRGGINAGIDTCWFNPRRKATPGDMKINYVIGELSELKKIVLGE